MDKAPGLSLRFNFCLDGALVAGRAALPISSFPWPNWIRRLTTNQKIRGSSPLGNDFLCFAAGGVPSQGLCLTGGAVLWGIGAIGSVRP